MINFRKSFQHLILRTLKTTSLKNGLKSNTEKHHGSIIIMPPKHSDFNEVLKFMEVEFIQNEPTMKSLNLSANSILMDKLLLSLCQGYSLIARCKNSGKLKGVATNATTNPWDADMVDKISQSIQCPDLKKVFRFFAFLEKAPNIFEKYKVNKVFEIAYLSVARDSQKKGIAKNLMEESCKIAQCKGFHLLRVDATSIYTAKICEKMNMELIYEIPYDSYLDDKKQPVFKIPSPHTAARVYVMKLNQRY